MNTKHTIIKELTQVIPNTTSNPWQKQESRRGVTLTAPKIGMRILWSEGVVLPCAGVGKWVVSGNEGVNRGRGICGFCLYICMSGVFDGVKVVLN